MLRATLVSVLLASAPVALEAQRPDPLGQLVTEALRTNLGLEGERLAERRATAEVREARGLFFPSLGLQSRYSRLGGVPNIGDLINPAYATLNQLTGTSRFPTNINFTLPQAHESRLELVQPVFNLGIVANYAVARARADGQRMQLAAAARQLAADVQVAYLQEASARRAVEIYDATQVLERADVEQQLAEAREQQLAAARALNRIVRRPLDAPVEAVPDSVFERLPLDITADSAVARALAAREELRQADAGVRTAQASGRAATAAFFPSVSVALDYGFQGPDIAFRSSNDFWLASVVVSWNLFNGGRDAARASEAAYEADRARTQRQDLADRIALQVRTAHEAAAVARSAITTADARLEAARRTFELVRRRYEEGVASPIEFVDARTAYTSAQLNRVLTAYRYAMRWVELERAAALREVPQ